MVNTLTQHPPIYVSLGGNEYATVTVTERDGKDLTGDNITAQLTKPGVKPTTWAATENVSGTGPVRVVRFLVTSGMCPTAGAYDMWVRINDGTEVPIRKIQGAVIAG